MKGRQPNKTAGNANNGTHQDFFTMISFSALMGELDDKENCAVNFQEKRAMAWANRGAIKLERDL